ncbi:MAG: hypothetical protein A2Y25_02555 [Candidatus Melainabacteria bacterium GWF2_37_15]|nr:MAG: hypothetical protein A2Y25_02555 [Candidatus Melainabacteria bacterium GWF2_37_15]
MLKKTKAFTLAEVLVTLAVIGVVAALTIPALIQNSQNAEAAAKVKKYSSVLNQVIKRYSLDNDCIGDLAVCGAFTGNLDQAGNQQVWDALKPYFKIAKDCDTNAGQGCFYTSYKYLNGTTLPGSVDDFNWAKARLADGISITLVDLGAGNCTSSKSADPTSPLYETICGAVGIDINGLKPPNQIGRDYFHFKIVKNGTVYPSGAFDDYARGCDPASGDTNEDVSGAPGFGLGCTAEIIKHGSINY